MSANKFIQNIIDNDLCIGCGLCEGIDSKMTMSLNEKGFLVPNLMESINNKSLQIIEKCCPGINTFVGNDIEEGFWGKSIGCYTGYSLDKKIRYAGSSGGSITAMLNELLITKEIDAVIQVGPNYEKSPFINEVYLNTTYEEIVKCASSRYSPSSPLKNITELLEKNINLAFVGKPCDVTALRNFAKIDDRVDKNIKYIFSFFCAGLPSEIGSDNVLKRFNVEKNDVKSFRYRGNGWPGKTTVILKDDTKAEMTYNESWGKILGKEIHFRCKICTDSIGMSADVVAADAWYSSGDGYPDFEEKDGRSLILSRTKKGDVLLNSMKNKKAIELENLDENEIYAMQPGQVSKRTELFGRLIALKLNPFQLVPSYSLKNIYQLSKRVSKIKTLRSFLGMYKRSLKKLFISKNKNI
jgi:coenzyme F420 hydrogenase subunit beta